MRSATGVSLVLGSLMLPWLAWCQGDDALTVAAKQVSDQFVKSSIGKRAEVLKVDQGTTPPSITVMLGSTDGVLEGQLLQVLAKGEPLTDEQGNVIDFEWTPVGNAEVTLVTGDRTCVARMSGPVMSGRLAKGNRAMVKTIPGALALSAFVRGDGAGCLMGQEFADKLATALQASGRFRVLERSRFEAVLAELKLGLNDLFDPKKTVPLGKQLQAKGVVVGKIDQQNASYTITVRSVDVETGVVVGAATTTCGRSDELDRKYAQLVSTKQSERRDERPAETGSIFSQALKWIRQPGNGRAPQLLHDQVITGGHYWADAIVMDGSATVILGGKWSRLHFEIARSNDHSSYRTAVSFIGDGRKLQSVDTLIRNGPVSVDLDVAGVTALTIDADCNCNPIFPEGRVYLRQGENMEQPAFEHE